MRLFIVRHGKAESGSATGRDRDRELAPRGVRQAQWLSEKLGELPVRPGLVLSSSFARARQTAEPVAARLGAELVFDERLEVGSTTRRVMAAAAEAAQESGVGALAVVGHNPTLQDLVEHLLRDGLEMQTGVCAEIEIDRLDLEGAARLVARHRLED